MNIRKNFEAIFLTAAALGLVASYATAAGRPVEVVQPATPPSTRTARIIRVKFRSFILSSFCQDQRG